MVKTRHSKEIADGISGGAGGVVCGLGSSSSPEESSGR